MSAKPVLGDDPFAGQTSNAPSANAPAAPGGAPAPAKAQDGPASRPAVQDARPGDGADQRRGRNARKRKRRRKGGAPRSPAARAGSARAPESPRDGEGNPAPSLVNEADRPVRAAPAAASARAGHAVPDEASGGDGAGPWEEGIDPAGEVDGDGAIGVEGAPPERDYGPPIDVDANRPARRTFADDLKEIERRVRERLLPSQLTLPDRRKLPLELVWRRWRDLAMRDRSEVVDEYGRDPLYYSRVEPFLEFLYTKYFRVDVSGLENIPDAGRALIVANHSGTLPYDGAMIMYALRRDHPAKREVRPLAEDFVFHFPYLGTFMNRIGCVRACQENAERLLGQDQLVVVFPEGVKGIGKLYKERYRLQRFGRGGFIKLALRSNAAIIPTAVIGAEEIHPMLGKLPWLARSIGVPYVPVTPTFPWLGPLGLVPLPTKWYLRFGAPLYFNEEYGADAAGDRILVNRLSEHVRSRIQEMIDLQVAGRKSILFG